MATYIVTYDLMQHGQNYPCLTKKLEAYPTHWHMQQSVWLIETAESAIQIRDSLTPCLDVNDKLFVARLANEAAWWAYAPNISEWLKGRLK